MSSRSMEILEDLQHHAFPHLTMNLYTKLLPKKLKETLFRYSLILEVFLTQHGCIRRWKTEKPNMLENYPRSY